MEYQIKKEGLTWYLLHNGKVIYKSHSKNKVNQLYKYYTTGSIE